MGDDGLTNVKKLLRELPTASAASAEAFRRYLPKLLLLVNEKASVETRYCDDYGAPEKPRAVEEGHKLLGELLGSVYEFGLYEALADEFVWFVSTLSSRGFDGNFFQKTLEGWVNGVRFEMPASASAELSLPLEILRANVATFLADLRPPPSEPEPPQDFLSLILANNRRDAASYVLELLKEGTPPEGVIHDVVGPALREIGLRWQRNDLGVADEHAATDICRYVVYRLFDAVAPRKALSRKALVTCVPGEEHELGARITAYYMELKGWRVYYIGRSLPGDEIVRATAREKPAAALFAATLISHLPAARDLARRVRDSSPGVKLVLGGRAAAVGREKLADVVDAVAATFEEGFAAASSLTDDDA